MHLEHREFLYTDFLKRLFELGTLLFRLEEKTPKIRDVEFHFRPEFYIKKGTASERGIDVTMCMNKAVKQ